MCEPKLTQFKEKSFKKAEKAAKDVAIIEAYMRKFPLLELELGKVPKLNRRLKSECDELKIALEVAIAATADSGQISGLETLLSASKSKVAEAAKAATADASDTADAMTAMATKTAEVPELELAGEVSSLEEKPAPEDAEKRPGLTSLGEPGPKRACS